MNDGKNKGTGSAKKRQSTGPESQADRRARAARALRANLGRRKTQARQRGDAADSGRRIGPAPKSPGTD
jgi:hypothetical protein